MLSNQSLLNHFQLKPSCRLCLFQPIKMLHSQHFPVHNTLSIRLHLLIQPIKTFLTYPIRGLLIQPISKQQVVSQFLAELHAFAKRAQADPSTQTIWLSIHTVTWPYVLSSAPHWNQYAMSHIISRVGACNLMLHIHITVNYRVSANQYHMTISRLRWRPIEVTFFFWSSPLKSLLFEITYKFIYGSFAFSLG